MKRGLIAWDKAEIPAAVFEQRIQKVRESLKREGLPALVVYSELWRSNQARFLSNYMPYFNRALLVIPLEDTPTLFCGLSPRVYSWIRSVTTIEDVRPAGSFARPLFQLATERNWQRIGMLDAEHLPFDLYQAIYGGELEILNVAADSVFSLSTDEAELTMRRRALAVSREILGAELTNGPGCVDLEFVGRLEGRLRRAGAEDLIILLTNGDGPPAPPKGARLENNFSLSMALEYRGHWVRLSRPQGSAELLESCELAFIDALGKTHGDKPGPRVHRICVENLSDSYPYEAMDGRDLRPNSIFALHIDLEISGRHVFYGDTCCFATSGLSVL